MIYVGVDIAKAEHCVTAMNESGQVVRKPRRISHDGRGFALLDALLRSLGDPDEVIVGMEATGHYWVLLAEELRERGWQVQVFNPLLSADAGRMTVRGRKTDPDDALQICKVLRDGGFTPVALGNGQAQLKLFCRYRQRAVERAANLKKRLQGYLDLIFPEFGSLFSDPCCATALALLEQAPSARLLQRMTPKRMTRMLRSASHGRLREERAERIRAQAKTSVAARRVDAATELAIQHTVAELQLLEQQIARYEQEIAAIAPEDCRLLQTIPGIGPILAAVILAEIGSIAAFTGRRGVNKLLAFAGLDPRIRESGTWRGRARMSKRGSRILRTAVWRAAFCARNDPGFAEVYQRHRHQLQQPFKLALSHVARKQVQAIYGVLRYQTAFDLEAFRSGVRTAA